MEDSNSRKEIGKLKIRWKKTLDVVLGDQYRIGGQRKNRHSRHTHHQKKKLPPVDYSNLP